MRVDEGEVVEDSTRIASRHATRGMKIDQRSRCEDRDDASISKVVEWFRALAFVLYLSLTPFPSLLPFSLSLAIESLFVGEYVRGNLDLNYSQFSLSHFQLYLARPRVPSNRGPLPLLRRCVGSSFHLRTFERSRISSPLLNRPFH